VLPFFLPVVRSVLVAKVINPMRTTHEILTTTPQETRMKSIPWSQRHHCTFGMVEAKSVPSHASPRVDKFLDVYYRRADRKANQHSRCWKSTRAQQHHVPEVSPKAIMPELVAVANAE